MTDRLNKIMRFLVISLPVVTLLGAYVALPFNRSLSLLAAVVAVLAVYGAALLASGRLKRSFGTAGWYCAFLIVLALYAAVSLAWAGRLGVSLWSFYYLAIGVSVVLFITAGVTRRQTLYRLLDVLTVCFVLMELLGVVEIFTGRFLFAPRNPQLMLRNDFYLYAPYACFANTNDYSSYITLFLPFAIYDVLLRLKGAAGKLAAAVLPVITAFVLLNANARACWFALALMAAVFCALAVLRHAPRKARTPLLLASAAVIVLAAVYVIHAGVFTRGANTLTMHDHSVSERFMLIVGAFKMLRDSHFFGVGVGGSMALMPYYTASVVPMNLHNMTLQILTEYGIIIFVFYAVFLISLLVAFFTQKGGLLRDRLLADVCFTVICAYPLVGIASSDMTHLTALWVVPGLWLASLRVLRPEPARAGGGKKLLFISFIDFGDMTSGSSVRPQRMYEAYRELGFEISLLSGLQNRRLERWRSVYRKVRALRKEGLPDLCYVEPPSGPFFNLCDHLLLIWLRRRGVPIGLFYRDAYWKFADWWPVHGAKRFFLIWMHRFDLFVIRRTCKIVFFPTQSMAELFDFRRMEPLPPAGVDFAAPPHEVARRALYIGGVSRNYGTDLLLKAFEIVNEREHRDIRLTVVCRASEQSDFFRGYAGRPWLEIAHASGDGQLRPYYERSDMAVYPSRRDFYMDFCMPVKLFEYLSRALPVVCTDCREAAAFVERSGIGLVAQSTPESIARKVIELYETPGLLEATRARCVEALRSGNLWVHRAQRAADAILN